MIKSVPGLKKHFAGLPPDVKEFYRHAPGLLDQFPLDVCLAYVFARLESLQNLAIYCGLVKLHRTHGGITWNVLLTHHFTRETFRTSCKTVFSTEVPPGAVALIQRAEGVRDQVMHGKGPEDGEMRNAIAEVLDYSVQFSAYVAGCAGFRPCGNLRGFKGAAAALEKSTTRWVLKGMGFPA